MYLRRHLSPKERNLGKALHLQGQYFRRLSPALAALHRPSSSLSLLPLAALPNATVAEENDRGGSLSRILLSLLIEHKIRRGPCLQVHARLLTSALHRHRPMGLTGIRLWNTLLRHYSQGCYPVEAVYLYKQMDCLCCPPLPADTFTFVFLLKAAANLSRPDVGSQFHCLSLKKGLDFDVYLGTAVVNMYAVCRCSVNAKKMFDEMPERNTVTWNAIITGLANWGELSIARLLFEQMPHRNVISWTGLIDGYTRARRPEDALALFTNMMVEGIKPTEITVLTVVPAISNLVGVEKGESLHAYCEKSALLFDVRVENSLIDMYAKCGAVENSFRLFDQMSDKKNLVSWTSIISGYAMHGKANEAVKLFEEMERAKVRPNKVTFLSILNACDHGGLVEEGLRFFASMVYEYGIDPEIRHYGCIIDIMGRAGRLGEAEEMIAGMPIEVNAIVWRTLLGCCSNHGDVKMAERVMRRILALEKEYSGDYVVLSNILTEAGRYTDAERVRMLIDNKNVLKVPGHSLICRNQ